MSLIEEALRRIQSAPHPPTSQSAPAPAPIPTLAPPEFPAPVAPLPSTAQDRPDPWIGFSLAWVAVALVVGGCVAAAFWMYRVMTLTTPAVVSLPAKSPSPQSAASAATSRVVVASLPMNALSRPDSPSSQPPAKPALMLNGIVEGVGEPFAIINGEIVHLGERVEGATLISVGENTAKLRRADEEVVLRTTR